MQFSIVIPTFNYGPFLVRALESCTAPTDTSFEIVVVDDGSTDDTADLVRRFRERAAVPVTYRRQDNRGVASARNHGAARARGEWLLFLDSDDQLLPGALDAFASGIAGGPGARVVAAGFWEADLATGGLRPVAAGSATGDVDANFAAFVAQGGLVLQMGAVVLHREVCTRLRFPEQLRITDDHVLFAHALALFPAATIAQRVCIRFRKTFGLMSGFEDHAREAASTDAAVFDPAILPAALMRHRRAAAAHRHRWMLHHFARNRQVGPTLRMFAGLCRTGFAAAMAPAQLRALGRAVASGRRASDKPPQRLATPLQRHAEMLLGSRSWRWTRRARNLINRLRGRPRETVPFVHSDAAALAHIANIHASLSWELAAPLRLPGKILCALRRSGAPAPSQEGFSATRPRLPTRGFFAVLGGGPELVQALNMHAGVMCYPSIVRERGLLDRLHVLGALIGGERLETLGAGLRRPTTAEIRRSFPTRDNGPHRLDVDSLVEVVGFMAEPTQIANLEEIGALLSASRFRLVVVLAQAAASGSGGAPYAPAADEAATRFAGSYQGPTLILHRDDMYRTPHAFFIRLFEFLGVFPLIPDLRRGSAPAPPEQVS